MPRPNIEAQEAEGTALMPQITAIAVLTEPEQFEAFYESMVSDIAFFTPDLTTAMGRAKIAQVARKVATTKTFLDATGKRLKDDARKQINAVDASRRAMRERLDALRDEVRAPLTEWEDREEKRKATVEQKFRWMLDAARWPLDADLQDVEQHRDDLVAFTVRDELFQDRADEAREYLAGAVEAVVVTIERIKKQFEAAVEIQRLQEAEADRKRKADEKAAAKAADLKASALREELAREADDKAERQKQEVAEAVEAAKEKAALEAETTLQRAREASEAEIRGLRDAEAQRKATADLDAKEQARRERNKKHRDECIMAATIHIATAGQIEQYDAGLIVNAIIAGGVPHVRLEF